MIVRIIENDIDYQKAIFLREEVLRKPLGLSFSEQEIVDERKHIHFGVFINDALLATASLVSEGTSCKMQRVAVSPDYQNQGYGSKLVNFIEQEAFAQGFATIYCHARDTAVTFYRSHGYVTIGEPFTEVGIDHLKMRKLLSGMIEVGGKKEYELIDNKIDKFNRERSQCKTLQREINYVIKVKEKIIAGINSCVYLDDVLYVEVIFIDDAYRNQALGSYLLGKVEDEAKKLGAKIAHLDTFDFQASRFYPKYGYEVFGVLDCPQGYKRYYFKKNLV